MHGAPALGHAALLCCAGSRPPPYWIVSTSHQPHPSHHVQGGPALHRHARWPGRGPCKTANKCETTSKRGACLDHAAHRLIIIRPHLLQDAVQPLRRRGRAAQRGHVGAGWQARRGFGAAGHGCTAPGACLNLLPPVPGNPGPAHAPPLPAHHTPQPCSPAHSPPFRPPPDIVYTISKNAKKVRKRTAPHPMPTPPTSIFSVSRKEIQVGMWCSSSCMPLAPGITPSCRGQCGGVWG